VLRKLLSCFLFTLFIPVSHVFAQATITAVYFPSSVASGGGTGTVGSPYAVYVQVQNWSAAAGTQAYLKIYFNTNNEYMWSATGVWSNTTTYAAANQPVVNIDAGGNWAGWIYAKHNNTLGLTPRLRAARDGGHLASPDRRRTQPDSRPSASRRVSVHHHTDEDCRSPLVVLVS